MQMRLNRMAPGMKNFCYKVSLANLWFIFLEEEKIGGDVMEVHMIVTSLVAQGNQGENDPIT